ncbi:glutaredoxin family protein [Sediminibacillus massiliensis]|uniref:glutaredoxin family protein n=1 Tax=Sediminibacillus massiliensis TaxID=1926277 RepID=UPI0009884F7E|nr:glutaredoxin family protein [Sediminibacillus massiliensis]
MTRQSVVVYVSENCRQCDQLLSHLDKWEVDYIEKNVTNNKEHIKELQEHKVYGTPAVFIQDQKILGFQKSKIKKALGIEPVYSFYQQSGLYSE